jgi:NADH dehydrogenase FAD-containing subunit
MDFVMSDSNSTTALKELALGFWSGRGAADITLVRVCSYLASLMRTNRNTDAGASKLLVEGKIKLKAGGNIERLTENSVKFTDGSELPADVVVFATG